MPKKTPEQKLAEFLEQEEARKRLLSCRICGDETLRAIVSAHLDKIHSGDTTITLAHVHRHLIVAQLNGPKSYESVKRHVRRCLGRDVSTGEPLPGEKR